MKNRSSLNKATWSGTREEQYKQSCDEILYRRNLDLSFVENQVYLKSDNEEIPLLEVTKEKTFWYETWKALKEI